MKNMHRHLVLFGALVTTALPLDAQQPVPTGASLVTLVAGPSPSKGGRTEVIRRASRSPQNVVIVSTNANADDLAGALALVNALRVTYGDAPSADYRARPETIRHGANWQDSEYRKWLQEQLVRLRKAPDVDLGEFGFGKAVRIMLPAPATESAATR